MRWLVFSFAVVACAEPTSEIVLGGDGSISFGPRDAAVDSAVQPVAPASPAPPVIVGRNECPSGWHLQEVGPTHVCAPFLDQPPVCGEGQMVLPGQETCTPVGRSCAGYPAEDSRVTLYVAAGEITASDVGSRTQPFHSIAAALAAAPPSSRVLLAEGEYWEEFTIDRGISVEGACAQGVVLRSRRLRAELSPNDPTFNGIVQMRGGELHNVSIDGIDLAGSAQGSRRAVTVVSGAAVVESVSVKDTQAGVGVYSNATASVTDSLFVRTSAAAIIALDQSRVTANRIEARDVPGSGLAIVAIDSTMLTLSNGFIRDSMSAIAFEGDSVTSLSNVAISGGLFQQVSVFRRATAVFTNLWVDRSAMGLGVAEDANVVGTDIVLRDIVVSPLFTVERGTAELNRVLVSSTDWRAPNLEEVLSVVGQRSSSDARYGLHGGIGASMQSRMTLSEVIVLGRGDGINVSDTAQVIATDVIIQDVHGRLLSASGSTEPVLVGEAFSVGALGASMHADIQRFTVRNTRNGIFMTSGNAHIRDLQIENSDDLPISVVAVVGDCHLALERALLSQSPDWSIMALSAAEYGYTASIDASDVAILNSKDGIEVWGPHSTLSGSRVKLEDFLDRGVLVGPASSLTLDNLVASPRNHWSPQVGARFSTAAWNYGGHLSLRNSTLSAGWSGLTISERDNQTEVLFDNVSIVFSPIGVWISQSELERLYAPISALTFANVSVPLSPSESLPIPETPDLSGFVRHQ